MGFILPSYLTIDVANQYFAARLNSDDWFNAVDTDQTASLIQATRAIDNLRYVGYKADPNQLTEFPRIPFPYGYPLVCGYYLPFCQPPLTPLPLPIPDVPQEILIACCEIAIVLLGGFDFEIELATLNTESTNFASVRETYDRRFAVEHLRAGIASDVAWNYLKPFLIDPYKISRG